jgi:hypothetical protein
VVLDFEGGDNVEEADSLLAAPYQLATPLRQIIEPNWRDRPRASSAKSGDEE